MEKVLRKNLPEDARQALLAAEASLNDSYCPHSGLSVGAGLIVPQGPCITGVNYESDSYGLTLCAERTAIARAQAEGRIQEIRGIVIAAGWQNSPQEGVPLSPCGACRQWIAELSRRLGSDIAVYSFWEGREEGLQTTALALLPGAFVMDPT